MIIQETVPLEVDVHRSPDDGVLVVQIDTELDTGRVRVNVNDSAIFDRDPEEPHPLQRLLDRYDGEMGSYTALNDKQREDERDTHYRAIVKLADEFAAAIREELNR